jgi:transcription antitermination factor NusB
MTNHEYTRNQLQEKSMQALYASLTYLDMKEAVDVPSIVSGILEKDYAECDIYVKSVVIQCLKHLNEIVPIYNAHMNHWLFERLNRVEQAILLLAYAQFFYVETAVDKGVVIDVAIKLTKAYCEGTDYKFVNAVLDKVLVRG